MITSEKSLSILGLISCNLIMFQSSGFMNHVSTSHLAQQLSSSASKLGSFQGSTSSALYDFNMSPSSRAPHPLSHSPLVNNFPVSPSIGSNTLSEVSF